MSVLVTGVAGFIGYHAAEALLARGEEVIGVDRVDSYYDVSLKEARLARLDRPGFRLVRADVARQGSDARACGAGYYACAAPGSSGRRPVFDGRSLCLCHVERDGTGGHARIVQAPGALAAFHLRQLVFRLRVESRASVF